MAVGSQTVGDIVDGMDSDEALNLVMIPSDADFGSMSTTQGLQASNMMLSFVEKMASKQEKKSE